MHHRSGCTLMNHVDIGGFVNAPGLNAFDVHGQTDHPMAIRALQIGFSH